MSRKDWLAGVAIVALIVAIAAGAVWAGKSERAERDRRCSGALAATTDSIGLVAAMPECAYALRRANR